ncbi:MAG: DUF4352 domain-containing protein [Bifidobacteriaceae bacterium]|nr:DUF4352 domain-containing protein [Bifidobacteriaceae bacterium]
MSRAPEPHLEAEGSARRPAAAGEPKTELVPRIAAEPALDRVTLTPPRGAGASAREAAGGAVPLTRAAMREARRAQEAAEAAASGVAGVAAGATPPGAGSIPAVAPGGPGDTPGEPLATGQLPALGAGGRSAAPAGPAGPANRAKPAQAGGAARTGEPAEATQTAETAKTADSAPPEAPEHGRPARSTARLWIGIGAAVATIGAAGVILLLTAFHVIGGADAPPASPSATATPTAGPITSAGPTPAAGQAGATAWSQTTEFVNGDFRLTLRDYTDQLTEIGDDGSWTAEQGQFVILEIEVEYTGDGDSGYFPLDEQRLMTDVGRSYPDDITSAVRYHDHPLGKTSLVPGTPLVGYLVFDIGKDERPTELRFVGDFLSPPVSIPLG